EAQKLAMADRDSWYGDCGRVPIDALLSDEYADARRTLISEAASLEFRPGRPEGIAPPLPPLRSPGTVARGQAGVGEPTMARTTLTPSFAYRDGKPYLAFGTPGGDQQDQWSLLLFLHHAHHGMNLQEAIDAPAFHTEHLVSSFWPREFSAGSLMLENRFPDATV